MRVRLKNILSVVLVSLVALPFTAPFSTYDLRHHDLDLRTPQAELLAAKANPEEDVALLGAAPAAPFVAPVFVLLAPVRDVDAASKHLIPSRILRL
jgi:hypothetical protein